ncbi:hypothetical protein B6I21_06835 [candidate division KSB1 bacterium 4572_119]|nr:MAG: hypothetical protein B6I21_06835 [candidate division KSB1 bacterium 4572_119]
MAQKTSKAHEEKKKFKEQDEEQEYSPEVLRIYKTLLRTMSWIVGVTFASVLVLPEFNSPFLDKITKVLFLIGFVDLIIFIIIEFVSDNVKSFLARVMHD